MAPHRDPTFLQGFTKTDTTHNYRKPPKLSAESLQRTMSDFSFELMNQETLNSKKLNNNDDRGTKKTSSNNNNHQLLPPISEIEDAKCECCGMSEECTPQYVKKIREKYSGKMICGLCSEAVKAEMEKNGGNIEEALNSHVSACAKFNRFGRAYPVLLQAEAMREMLRKNRSKSLSPRDKGGINNNNNQKITRSSSCMPSISKEMTHAHN